MQHFVRDYSLSLAALFPATFLLQHGTHYRQLQPASSRNHLVDIRCHVRISGTVFDSGDATTDVFEPLHQFQRPIATHGMKYVLGRFQAGGSVADLAATISNVRRHRGSWQHPWCSGPCDQCVSG